MPDYDIRLDVRHGPLERIDVAGLAAAHEPWFNQTLCRVGQSVVRLGIIEGDFHWHHHDDEDEFFYVLEGKLYVDLEGRTIELAPGHGTLVPKGVRHRTRAPERTVLLMFAGATVTPTGD